MNKPKLNNGFIDRSTGIEFIIPSSRQVSITTARREAAAFIKTKKDILFRLWKKLPHNRKWKGNINAKKSELFAKKYRRGSLVTLIRPNKK